MFAATATVPLSYKAALGAQQAESRPPAAPEPAAPPAAEPEFKPFELFDSSRQFRPDSHDVHGSSSSGSYLFTGLLGSLMDSNDPPLLSPPQPQGPRTPTDNFYTPDTYTAGLESFGGIGGGDGLMDSLYSPAPPRQQQPLDPFPWGGGQAFGSFLQVPTEATFPNTLYDSFLGFEDQQQLHKQPQEPRVPSTSLNPHAEPFLPGAPAPAPLPRLQDRGQADEQWVSGEFFYDVGTSSWNLAGEEMAESTDIPTWSPAAVPTWGPAADGTELDDGETIRPSGVQCLLRGVHCLLRGVHYC